MNVERGCCDVVVLRPEMRVVVALGGNALLRRDQTMSPELQRQNVGIACDHLAPIAQSHELIVSHGNGPQIGFLAEEEAAFVSVTDAPLDVLGAETQGMIGYLIEQELGNRLAQDRPLVTVLTMIEVDAADPAFEHPTKPIGPRCTSEDAIALAAAHGWTFAADGDQVRRVVASPTPRRIVESRPITWMIERGCVVICAGGGGIPITTCDGVSSGVDAVIDKDRASALLAEEIGADVLILATDASGAYLGFGGPDPKLIERAHPTTLLARYRDEFAEGSMLPKVEAACAFALRTGSPAAIGDLTEIDLLLNGTAGTRIATDIDGIVVASEPPEREKGPRT
jgi:carbamate kinase